MSNILSSGSECDHQKAICIPSALRLEPIGLNQSVDIRPFCWSQRWWKFQLCKVFKKQQYILVFNKHFILPVKCRIKNSLKVNLTKNEVKQGCQTANFAHQITFILRTVGILGSPAEVCWYPLYNMVPRCMSHHIHILIIEGHHTGTTNFTKTSAKLLNYPTKNLIWNWRRAFNYCLQKYECRFARLVYFYVIVKV